MFKILLIDNDQSELEPLLERVGEVHNWSIQSSSSIEDGAAALRQAPLGFSAAVLLSPPGQDAQTGLANLERLREVSPELPVVIIADCDSRSGLDRAVLSLRAGAWDFLLRADLNEEKLVSSLVGVVSHSRATAREFDEEPQPPRLREPAFLRFFPSGEWTTHVCAFALRLRGLSSATEAGDARETLEGRQLEWARKLLSGVFSAEEGRVVELRYLATRGTGPDERTMVTLYLVGIGKGQDEQTAARAARALWTDIDSLTRLDPGVYQFWTVESLEDLRFLLCPFKPGPIVELSGSPGRLVIQKAAPGISGFQGKPAVGEEATTLELPILFETPPKKLGPLLGALTTQSKPIQVILRFEAAGLSPDERDFLAGVQEQLEGGVSTWRIEYPSGATKLASREAATGNSISTMLGGLSQHYVCRCLVVGSESIERPLRSLAADAMFGADSENWVIDTWSSADTESDFLPWGIALRQLPLGRRLRHIQTVSRAWTLFRLPVVGDGAIPGIDMIPLSYGYCPVNLPSEGLKIGEKRTSVGLFPVYQHEADRLRHTYILGQTGTGKSTLMATMAIQDMEEGRGLSVLDPHGDLIQDLLSAVPKERMADVVLFDVSDVERPAGLNLLEYDRRSPQQKTFLINEIMAIFDTLYDLRQTGGPMFENYMFNTMLLLMEDTEIEATLLHVRKVFVDRSFRKQLLERSHNDLVKEFWEQALAAGGEASLANMAPYITSKLNQFVSNDILRPIIQQPRSSIDFRSVMDERKILLVNLAKGFAGTMSSALLGMIIVAKIMAAALGRFKTPREERTSHFLYVDEFQNFTSRSVPQMLAEVRKYGLGLILANQNLQQLDDATVHAVLGNVGTTLFFRPGPLDAERIRPYVEPTFSRADCLGLPNFAIVARLLLGNVPSKPFLFNTAWRPRAFNPGIRPARRGEKPT